ncbi:plasmid stabilization system protein, RelE/ParE family [Nitrosococcus oceani AFC27]|uniref:Plasmid stabilization protein n=1 Tax=Nitrosococcus oceani C-27 TaxID=314279 RepID=A0A0E2ZQ40_9GAMM|nr:plasmid stabilization system protein, RelE/ParE family [Nitrosococcus oceani AFC27]KFI20542.1 plasmid stabilization protein [Nitrosococcus oceani C-27]GEM20891.1 toxin Y4kP [Nitrosococcus oceani]
MEVKWLNKALQNLDAEAAYIAQDNPAAARRVVQTIVDAINLLSDNPALGRPGRVPGTRELVVADTHYLVPYRVRPRLQQIEVLRVFHTSRRLPEHW